MTARELEEYIALRATIRQRGTARVWLFFAGMAVWAAMVMTLVIWIAPPAATLAPLLVLAAAFEGVFALHVGVERIGRYLQVFCEPPGSGGQWEHVAMAFGRSRPRALGTDPLFFALFVIAVAVNFAPVLVAAPLASEAIALGAAHAALLARLIVARRAAGAQRAADLARFNEMKNAM